MFDLAVFGLHFDKLCAHCYLPTCILGVEMHTMPEAARKLFRARARVPSSMVYRARPKSASSTLQLGGAGNRIQNTASLSPQA
jgi:hypothetical protein